ncbi:alkyl hydroperoxide reductase subunit C (plasmid) [Sinorhizobium americanum]|uniref:Alkyl hydroperoxide reductase C n=1 Tax=Sinorhizobium americanum TaxID=194963 RepID=A0A1L3LUA8_9HYPH|nr:alkyl hydroperoxide reductase subunit C [Sinorhizobium americanum CCGM7]APG93646.1 alkyl hydroperoxide reductase subunit C [Sinorhizobium americanum]
MTDADVLGRWAIFFFYPADFTFVCPTELGDVADLYAELQRPNVEIYSVSTDTHLTHKAWHDSSDTIRKIEYTMIGDPTGTVTRNFEIMRETEGLADRGTFIVDPDGIIQAIEITAEGIGRNAADLLRRVKAAQYVRAHPGEVCPAKWEQGGKTLAPSLALVGKIRSQTTRPRFQAGVLDHSVKDASRNGNPMLDDAIKSEPSSHFEKSPDRSRSPHRWTQARHLSRCTIS